MWTIYTVWNLCSYREAKTCLAGRQVVFVGDSRIRSLFVSFVNIIAPQSKQYPNKVRRNRKQDRVSLEMSDFSSRKTYTKVFYVQQYIKVLHNCLISVEMKTTLFLFVCAYC